MAPSKPGTGVRGPHVALLSSALLASAALLLLPRGALPLAPSPRAPAPAPAPVPVPAPNLTVLTFAHSAAVDNLAHMLVHNCLMLRSSGFRFELHTDRTGHPVCTHCNCVHAALTRCPCPNPTEGGCQHCEKLHFVIRQLQRLGEFLFLDADLLILKDTFLPRLYPRTRVHDALAAYGHISPNATLYYGPFNSGLIFLRRLPGLDYSEMLRTMYKKKANGDQNVITWFVQEHYENWDTLSIQWHCRFLQREGYQIPPTECYTLHDRHEGWRILQKMNYSLLSAPYFKPSP